MAVLGLVGLAAAVWLAVVGRRAATAATPVAASTAPAQTPVATAPDVADTADAVDPTGATDALDPTDASGPTDTPDAAAVAELSRVSGLGRRSAEALVAGGVRTLADLAARTDDELAAVLDAAGVRRSTTLATWPSQARRLVAG